jgi:hypothetical protein
MEPKLVSEILAIEREENYSVAFQFREAMKSFVADCQYDQLVHGIGHFNGLEAALKD